jgi:UDP-2-acetamido-3-amino-2,3-dideoxy-glucuronate N-acetyltransferase
MNGLDSWSVGQRGLQILRMSDGRLGNRAVGRYHPNAMTVNIHPSACVDPAAEIGPGTSIWHFSHIMAGARIGGDCTLGQNVFVAAGVVIGRHVKIQNNVSLYAGVELEDEVFCGPSCVFTNVINPRCEVVRRSEYRPTRVLRGASIGANSTILCGITIGRYAMIGAGAVVVADVPQYALMLGVPAAPRGYFSRHGYRLPAPDAAGETKCPGSGWRYQLGKSGVLTCLDWPEDKPLPDPVGGKQAPPS